MGSEFKDSDDEEIMAKCVRDSEEFCDKDRFARENHSEIERRRRNKMTAYIAELSDMVPACNSLARKPDKLTILRMAVAHMKSLRGSSNLTNDSSYKPSFLTDQELKHLLLEAADGFLFVIHCDSGMVIYASDTIVSVLGHRQEDWSGSSIFEYLHPDDVNKVKEQLCSSWDTPNNQSSINSSLNNLLSSQNANNNIPHNSIDNTTTINNKSPGSLNPGSSNTLHTNQNQAANTNNTACNGSNNNMPANTSINNNRVLDLKTGTIKKEGHHQSSNSARFCMGTRRGFICRIKCGLHEPSPQNAMKNHPRSARAMLGPSRDGEQYAVVHCTGYIKHWPPSNTTLGDKNALNSAIYQLPPNNSITTPNNHSNSNSVSHFNSNYFCLVAIGRLQIASAPNINDILTAGEGRVITEFVSRHDTSNKRLLFDNQNLDQIPINQVNIVINQAAVSSLESSDQLNSVNNCGRTYDFTFVDQRVFDVLGYQTQEVLGKSCFEFYHPDDMNLMKETFEQVIKMKGQMMSVMYRFRHKSGKWICLQSNLYAFLNPYSEALEFIIANNSLAKPLKCDRIIESDPQTTLVINEQPTYKNTFETLKNSAKRNDKMLNDEKMMTQDKAYMSSESNGINRIVVTHNKVDLQNNSTRNENQGDISLNDYMKESNIHLNNVPLILRDNKVSVISHCDKLPRPTQGHSTDQNLGYYFGGQERPLGNNVKDASLYGTHAGSSMPTNQDCNNNNLPIPGSSLLSTVPHGDGYFYDYHQNISMNDFVDQQEPWFGSTQTQPDNTDYHSRSRDWNSRQNFYTSGCVEGNVDRIYEYSSKNIPSHDLHQHNIDHLQNIPNELVPEHISHFFSEHYSEISNSNINNLNLSNPSFSNNYPSHMPQHTNLQHITTQLGTGEGEDNIPNKYFRDQKYADQIKDQDHLHPYTNLSTPWADHHNFSHPQNIISNDDRLLNNVIVENNDPSRTVIINNNNSIPERSNQYPHSLLGLTAYHQGFQPSAETSFYNNAQSVMAIPLDHPNQQSANKMNSFLNQNINHLPSSNINDINNTANFDDLSAMMFSTFQ
ncbi:unnamed protein product [Gordionus sp. m RMFG-2023]